MVHWIDNIAFSVDFRKNRKKKPETLEQVAAQIIDFRKQPGANGDADFRRNQSA
jgi:hypothetical protein